MTKKVSGIFAAALAVFSIGTQAQEWNPRGDGNWERHQNRQERRQDQIRGMSMQDNFICAAALDVVIRSAIPF